MSGGGNRSNDPAVNVPDMEDSIMRGPGGKSASDRESAAADLATKFRCCDCARVMAAKCRFRTDPRRR